MRFHARGITCPQVFPAEGIEGRGFVRVPGQAERVRELADVQALVEEDRPNARLVDLLRVLDRWSITGLFRPGNERYQEREGDDDENEPG